LVIIPKKCIFFKARKHYRLPIFQHFFVTGRWKLASTQLNLQFPAVTKPNGFLIFQHLSVFMILFQPFSIYSHITFIQFPHYFHVYIYMHIQKCIYIYRYIKTHTSYIYI
jgi:hypothetical protein